MKEEAPSGGTNMTEKDKIKITELRKPGYVKSIDSKIL